jgi:hypothetical protein
MTRRMDEGRPPRRPLVTAAAVVLILLSVLNIALAAYLVSEWNAIDSDDRGAAVFSIGLTLVIGLAQLVGGVRTMSMKEAGRKIGVLVATLGLALAVTALLQGSTQQLLGVALNGFVLYALSKERPAFR